MPSDRRDAASFLQMIRRSGRGRLKVYLGYGPGVGKTYAALQEVARLKAEGVDAVVAYVEDHGRPQTRALVDNLEVVSRRVVSYHGIAAEEMDVEAVLARKPEVALVDELAHTNLPGGRHAKRYEDVRDLLAAGVHVITTVNVQHLESLYDTVERLTGVKVRERLPDAVLAEADVVVNVDVAPDDLRKRLEAGNVYPEERARQALANFFVPENLAHLRELTLREAAGQIDTKRRERGEPDTPGGEQVMVCLSSRGPGAAKLLRAASRLAGRLNRDWYAVYVQTPKESATQIAAADQRKLAATLKLANDLGATVFTFKGEDVAATILRFARGYGVTHVVVGRPRPSRWQKLLGRRGVLDDLIGRGDGLTLVIVDAGTAFEAEPIVERPPPASASLDDLLVPNGVVAFDTPMTRADAVRRLAELAAGGDLDVAAVVTAIEEREAMGSTFLNAGVALPHARLPGLRSPRLSIGLPRAGIVDPPPGAESPEAIALLLTPDDDAGGHLKALARVARLLADPAAREALEASAVSRTGG